MLIMIYLVRWIGIQGVGWCTGSGKIGSNLARGNTIGRLWLLLTSSLLAFLLMSPWESYESTCGTTQV
jgi:hypothetical protein